ncbi:hypothetical protein PROFUN_01888 [Planoprotostelium fungivorum]|uniref:Uncharacterized protein n=1 Tax=Planoprotostelium fungivorum TaxID=1890364 RepID=A0A2P6NZ18_9EUKA|nr:hypothetical protein PROFUN_01888 [Planoprotostelium fungivorum]
MGTQTTGDERREYKSTRCGALPTDLNALGSKSEESRTGSRSLGSIASLIDATLSSDSEAQSDHSSQEERDPTRQRVRASFVFVVRAGMNMRDFFRGRKSKRQKMSIYSVLSTDPEPCAMSEEINWNWKVKPKEDLDDSSFSCRWGSCEQTFHTRTGLATHVSSHLSEHQPRQTGRRQKTTFSCVWGNCDSQFGTLRNLAKHLSSSNHVGQMPFLTKLDETDNTTTSQEQKPKKRYFCGHPNCSKSFTDSSNRKKHERTHDATRERFHCEEPGCTKSYSTRTDLNIHRKIHKGEFPHKCTHTNCQKAFIRLSELYAHERTHDNILPHSCSVCGRSFRERARLRRHEEQQHNIRSYDESSGSPTPTSQSPTNLHPPIPSFSTEMMQAYPYPYPYPPTYPGQYGLAVYRPHGSKSLIQSETRWTLDVMQSFTVTRSLLCKGDPDSSVRDVPLHPHSTLVVFRVMEASCPSESSKVRKSCTADTRALLLTYRRFITSDDLFQLWYALYPPSVIIYVLSLTQNSVVQLKKQTAIVEHLSEFMIAWIRLFNEDISAKIRGKIISIVDRLPHKNEVKLLVLKSFRSPFSSFNGRQMEILPPDSNSLLIAPYDADNEAFCTLLESPNAEPTLLPNFVRVTCDDIAGALTLQQWTCFIQIRPVDLLRKIHWVGKSKDSSGQEVTPESPLDHMIEMFNRISHWVINEILIQKEGALQRAVLQKMIRIAKRLTKIGNFDATLAIVSGLNSFGIQRLRGLWSRLDERHSDDFNKLDALFLPVGNFRNYNAALAEHKGPLLPYVGVFLRDLTFVAENPSIDSNGKIDFSVCRSISDRCDVMMSYQKEAFRLPAFPEQLTEFLSGLTLVEKDDDIYRLSVKAEAAAWGESENLIEGRSRAGSIFRKSPSARSSTITEMASPKMDHSGQLTKIVTNPVDASCKMNGERVILLSLSSFGFVDGTINEQKSSDDITSNADLFRSFLYTFAYVAGSSDCHHIARGIPSDRQNRWQIQSFRHGLGKIRTWSEPLVLSSKFSILTAGNNNEEQRFELTQIGEERERACLLSAGYAADSDVTAWERRCSSTICQFVVGSQEQIDKVISQDSLNGGSTCEPIKASRYQLIKPGKLPAETKRVDASGWRFKASLRFFRSNSRNNSPTEEKIVPMMEPTTDHRERSPVIDSSDGSIRFGKDVQRQWAVRCGVFSEFYAYFEKAGKNETSHALLAAKYLTEMGRHAGLIDGKRYDDQETSDLRSRLMELSNVFTERGFGRLSIMSDTVIKSNRKTLLFRLENGCECVDKECHPSQQTCAFTAGYLGGWCSSALHTDLACAESFCHSTMGGDCKFIVCDADKLESRAKELSVGRREEVEKSIGLSIHRMRTDHVPLHDLFVVTEPAVSSPRLGNTIMQ